MTRLLFSLALAAIAAPSFAAQPLGKLFFTPAERAQLDQMRNQKQPPPVAKAQEPAPAAAPPQAQILTYGGVVRRSDGKAVLWLNNKPVEESEAFSSLPVTGRVRSDGGMTVRVPETGRTVDLKVGQSVELGSGTVAERPPRPAPAPVRKSPEAERSPAPAPERAAPNEPAPAPSAPRAEEKAAPR